MSVSRRLIAGPRRALGLVLGALAALVGCGSPMPTNPTPVCSYTLASSGQSFSSDGGPGSVTVTTGASCAWAVQGAAGWVTLSSAASATGPGTVTYTVLPNMEAAARDTTLTAATQAYKISQDGRAPCAYTISPEQQQFSDEGGTGEVQVTAGADCAWTAKSTVPWLAIVAGASGSGPGAVSYKADPNNGTALRTGTLVVATRTLTVNQDGEDTPQPANCQYSVTPVDFSPCMDGVRLTASVVTQARCQWTVSVGAPWLSVQGASAGAGAGTIAINVPDNYDAPREGVIMVRWPTPTAGQNISVQQAGCLYGVSQDSFTVAAAGGPGSFTVVQESVPNTCGGPLQDRCVWSAQSSVAWITIVSHMPMTGDNPVAFSVAANTGSAARTGRITVRDRSVTVTQAAP